VSGAREWPGGQWRDYSCVVAKGRVIERGAANHRAQPGELSKMIQTSGGRRAYNVFAIPLAAGVLAWQGILLPPALAAMLMSAAPSLWRSTPSF
jgi:hypothetical protein